MARLLLNRCFIHLMENSDAFGRGNRGKDPQAVSPTQGGRAIRHRAGAAGAQDGAMARHIRNYFWVRAQSRIDAGRLHGRGFGFVILGRGRSDNLGSAAGDHRLYDHRNCRGRLRVAGASLDAHGLWPARRQMGALVSAHDRLDLLVRVPDRRRLARGCRDPRPVDRNVAFAGHSQRHLRGAAGDCRDHRLRFAEAPLANCASVQNSDPVVCAGFAGNAQ